MTKVSRKCAYCRKRFRVSPRGRPAEYCSRSCRQWAYIHRKFNRPALVQLLRRDLDRVQVQDLLREEIRNVLQKAGFEIDPKPRATLPEKKPRPSLKVIVNDRVDVEED